VHYLLTYTVPFLVVLTVLVFVHEYGHYRIARRNGVRVEVFSIGFGPELFGWTDRAGTRWRFSALPLGGYVRMFGFMPEEEGTAPASLTPEERAVSFTHKRILQKMAVIVAGPAANFLFAMIMLTALYATVGDPIPSARIGVVAEGSVAEAAGIHTDDVITAINGQEISDFRDIFRAVRENPEGEMRIEFDREGRTMVVALTPKLNAITDIFGRVHKSGQIGLGNNKYIDYREMGVGSAVGLATGTIWAMVAGTVEAIWGMAIHALPPDNVGGILQIMQFSGDALKKGVISLCWFMAILSVNLGLINLFPIPILDGGRLVFYAAEALRGRPLGPRTQEVGNWLGLAMVMSLMVFANWNDLVRFGLLGSLLNLMGHTH